MLKLQKTQTVQKLFVCWCTTQPAHVLEMFQSRGILKRIGTKREASMLCVMLHPIALFGCDASYVRACSSDGKYKVALISLPFPFLLRKHKKWGKLLKICRIGRLNRIKKIMMSCYSVQCFSAPICFALSSFPEFFSLQDLLHTVLQRHIQVIIHVNLVYGGSVCKHRHTWFQDKMSLYIP